MVLYFVELGDDDTSTKLYQKVHNIDTVEYQGILTNYKTERDNRVALFVVEDIDILKFKLMFPLSSTIMPVGVPKEVYEYFKNC
jgi:hypothetical protein